MLSELRFENNDERMVRCSRCDSQVLWGRNI